VFGANSDGRREVLGMQVGASETELFWTDFLRSLIRRGLRSVKLVISDAHEGLKAAVRKVISATWQRCRVHFMRNVLVHAPAGQRRTVSALIATIFAQESEAAAQDQWRIVADQLRERFPKIARLMDDAEDDVLAHMGFPREHWAKIHSTNPLERLNGEIKRRTDVVGVFPNEAAIYRLVGALLLEQNDEWTLQRRYMTLETLAEVGQSRRQPVRRDSLTGMPTMPETMTSQSTLTPPRGTRPTCREGVAT
jgi:putative transposase